MINNVEKYKKDIQELSNRGNKMMLGLYYELRDEMKESYSKLSSEQKKAFSSESFSDKYHEWYNESLSVIRVLLPDRLNDFVSYYKYPNRKDISSENYSISDYLIGLQATNKFGRVTKIAAISKFQQQLDIVKSLQSRFDSSLYDIRQLLQADLFDGEIDAARELCSKGFYRASGAICGVVLEKHFAEVCKNHSVAFNKKKLLHLSDYNDAMKDSQIIDIITWRQIQRLADIRNLCDHKKDREPYKDEIEELINASDKYIKTLF